MGSLLSLPRMHWDHESQMRNLLEIKESTRRFMERGISLRNLTKAELLQSSSRNPKLGI
jgi:hypothetical protein